MLSRRFTDDPLTICPECGGALRKVYGAVGIAFKGSGFYKTDSRAASAASNGEAKKSEGGHARIGRRQVGAKSESTTKADGSKPSSDGRSPRSDRGRHVQSQGVEAGRLHRQLTTS